ncbi:MAG: HAMP domain-containing sensor histidine kinase [Chitinophagaceae bacterium]
MKLFSNSHHSGKGARQAWLLLSFMLLTILVIAGFQGYWLRDNYNREKQSLDIKTNAAFRQTILRLQASKFQIDAVTMNYDSANLRQTAMMSPPPPGRPRPPASVRIRPRKPDPDVTITYSRNEPTITVANLIQERLKDIDIPDSISHAFGRVVLSGVKDTLRRVTDSLQKYLRLPLNGFIGNLDLDEEDSIDLASIRHVKVERSGVNKAAKSQVTIRYAENKKEDREEMRRGMAIARVAPGITSTQGAAVRVTAPMHIRDSGRTNVFRFLYDMDSLSQKDSVTIKEIDSAFAKRLDAEKLNVDFAVSRVNRAKPDSSAVNEVTVGFASPMTYRLSLDNEMGFLFGKLKLPILFSILLVGVTIASFVALYRSLMKQHRLAQMKNDLISNITHELKTPIATVGVAIEALKNFNALQDPQRTREYLDISQNELQRLGLLVDKVLKLSMFEKKDIELKSEYFDLKDVLNEVVASLRLQLEKYHAKINIQTEGDTFLKGDRLHLLSVVFNLLDNALKYSKEDPFLEVSLKEVDENLELIVKDNGIGIPSQYKEKVFEKFFRVPAGDTHNAKGHGLGLSYVAQVIRQHNGTIKVDSREGFGSTFTIVLPKSIT